jgi:RNA polymerase sigma-70 factor (ECF subfamily)
VAARGPAVPEALDALATLCRDYWYPLYAFIRRSGHDADAALDLTQAYFARLIEKGTLRAADPAKGRFRAFLRADYRFFLAHEREREAAAKRGGDHSLLSIDATEAEGHYLREPSDPLTPDRLFDRAWALGLLASVLEALAREHADAGRSAQFEVLRGVLVEGPRSTPYAKIAARLGTSEAAVQQAVRRLRARYRAILRERIAATLDDPTDAAIDDEIRDLFAALSR